MVTHRSHQPCKVITADPEVDGSRPATPKASGKDVVKILIANIAVPMAGPHERVSALVAFDEGSLSVIGYVLADGGAQAHHMPELLANSVKRVRHASPNATIVLTVDHGAEFQDVMRVSDIVTYVEQVRYRSIAERAVRCFVRAFTKHMLQAFRPLRRPDGKLTCLRPANLEMAMNIAIDNWHQAQFALGSSALRRKVEHAFRTQEPITTARLKAVFG